MSRKAWSIIIVVAVAGVGIYAWQRAGIVLRVQNDSDISIEGQLTVEGSGECHTLVPIVVAAHSRRAVRVEGCGAENTATFELLKPQRATIFAVGYFERGEPYCGRPSVMIHSDGRLTSDPTVNLYPWCR